MLVIGLTGSIGMGKTAVAGHIASRGVPILDSDSIVHRLYAGEAAAVIDAAFPGTVVDGLVDRSKLAAAVVATEDGFARLEALIHPLVRQAQWQFLQEQQAAGASLVVLDIPLLFETGGDQFMDATIVVSAPADVQAARVLARSGMTLEKLEAIRARQLPDAQKRVRADFVVDTGLAWEDTRKAVDKLLESLKEWPATAMERWRRLFA